MENASKALIIAGAILISILIIGLGVFIYNKAKGAMDDSIGLDSQKIESVNSKFEAYEGTITGTDARALVDAIRTYNNNYDSSAARDIAITVQNVTGASNIGTKNLTKGMDVPNGDYSILKSKLNSGSKYEVKFEYYANTAAAAGYIGNVTIKGL